MAAEKVGYTMEQIHAYAADLWQALGQDQHLPAKLNVLVGSLLALPLPPGWRHVNSQSGSVTYVSPVG